MIKFDNEEIMSEITTTGASGLQNKHKRPVAWSNIIIDPITHRQPPAQALKTITFSSGVNELTPSDRAALPF